MWYARITAYNAERRMVETWLCGSRKDYGAVIIDLLHDDRLHNIVVEYAEYIGKTYF